MYRHCDLNLQINSGNFVRLIVLIKTQNSHNISQSKIPVQAGASLISSGASPLLTHCFFKTTKIEVEFVFSNRKVIRGLLNNIVSLHVSES